MAIRLSRLIRGRPEDVFRAFDDFAEPVKASVHAVRFEIVDTRPDGRRTADVVMRAGAKEWMQTIEQILREPPRRLVTRAWSWTSDRGEAILTVTTDRHFTAEADRTRVDVTIESRLNHPLRQPFWAILNWLRRGAARAEFERQLNTIAIQVEAAAESPGRDLGGRAGNSGNDRSSSQQHSEGE